MIEYMLDSTLDLRMLGNNTDWEVTVLIDNDKLIHMKKESYLFDFGWIWVVYDWFEMALFQFNISWISFVFLAEYRN